MKTCSKCLAEKDLSEFHKDKTAKDLHSSACKSCRNLSKRKHPTKLIVSTNPEMIKESLKLTEKTTVPLSLSLEDLISELLLKHHSFISLTISREGKARMQIMTQPNLHYRADSLEKLLKIVEEGEGV